MTFTAIRRSPLLLHALALAAVSIVTLITFAGVRGHGILQWDDQLHLTENPYLRPVDPDRYAHFWRTPYAKLYVPITYNVWAWIYARSFDDAGVFSPRLLHEANLIAHVLATALVYLLLNRLLRERVADDRRIVVASMIGAAFFGLHPLQVEAVAWISELRGLLAADFALAAMLIYIVGAQKDRRAGRVVCLLGGLLLFAGAMLCKPSVASVPAVLFVLDRWWLGRSWQRICSGLLPWFAVSLASLVFMRSLQTGDIAAPTAFWRRPFVAGDALSFYLSRLVWPFDLAADYSRTPMIAARSTWFWLAWIVPVFLASIFVWRRQRSALFALAIFVASLLPVLGLVPFAFQRISTVADRYAYLALFGPALLVAMFLVRVKTRPGRWFAGAALVLVLFTLRSIDQLQNWRDDTTLWQHAIATNPQSLVGLSNVGEAQRRAGDRDGAKRLFERAAAISPAHEGALFGLASVSADAGDFETARATYDRAALLNADEPSVAAAALDGAGWMFVRMGRPVDAELRYRAALAADPTFANGHNDLGALLLDHQRVAEARPEFERALALRPNHSLGLLNLAATFDAAGDHASAEQTLRRAADVLPREPTPRKRLGRRAMDANDWPTAIDWYGRALSLDANDADTLNDLGQCQAAAGRIEESILSFERAVALRPDLSALRENLQAAKSLRQPPSLRSGP